MATYITPLPAGPGTGPRLAVKDIIDVAGVPTTAGSRAVAETAGPAAADAACLAGARAAGARPVGKANLHELAFGASGVNEWFGTPRNPLDPTRVPGGSSSGSAVAVAEGTADVAYGTDTGGSIRIPSAFCGTVGLKTTFGRVPIAGVRALAVSLDTVGPMARDVAGTTMGMGLLDPSFGAGEGRRGAVGAARTVARVRPGGVPVDPVIDAAIDRALAEAGFEVTEVEIAEWASAYEATTAILDREAAESNRELLDDPGRRALLGGGVAARLEAAAAVTAERLAEAQAFRSRWAGILAGALRRAEVLALPTVPFFPPPLGEAAGHRYTLLTNPVNLAGLPALSVPVPAGGRLPAGLQLIGPAAGEALLLATGAAVESATADR